MKSQLKISVLMLFVILIFGFSLIGQSQSKAQASFDVNLGGGEESGHFDLLFTAFSISLVYFGVRTLASIWKSTLLAADKVLRTLFLLICAGTALWLVYILPVVEFIIVGGLLNPRQGHYLSDHNKALIESLLPLALYVLHFGLAALIFFLPRRLLTPSHPRNDDASGSKQIGRLRSLQ